MPRNAEVIRQWTILRDIERSRTTGVTIDDLASRCGVTTRTIRRDLQALQESGFPLFDDRSADDGRTRWQINGQAFKGLAAGLTLSELSALYFSRVLVESLSAASFHEDVEAAFEKLSSGLTPHMRQFLDRLPHVIATKPDPQRRRASPDQPRLVSRALEATIAHRQATLTYHSKSSDRTKVYLVHPYRLAYAQGGLYLQAFVPEYAEVRTFAMERIKELSLLEEHFVPLEELPDEPAFAHSLGVHSGPPETVVVEFQREVADYVEARDWHPSQTVEATPDGNLRLTLQVCVDRTLTSWILSFGASARVLAPETLQAAIVRELRAARERYVREPRA